jgi:hypothetical protein
MIIYTDLLPNQSCHLKPQGPSQPCVPGIIIGSCKTVGAHATWRQILRFEPHHEVVHVAPPGDEWLQRVTP